MRGLHHKAAAVLGAAAMAAAVSACGSTGTPSSSAGGTNSSGTTGTGSGATSTSGTGAGTTTSGAATPTVDLATVPGAGKVLVTAGGDTLYVFAPDHQAKSTCSSACATVWPPLLTTGTPSAGAGVTGSALGTVQRQDGSHQVTYHHWPLYTFTGDTGPGHARGNGLDSYGGKWSTIDAAGNAFGSTPSSSTTTTGGYGSGGYGSGGSGY